MSFFRVLLALLIAGGIALGLYVAVDGRGLDRAVEAVRTEIASRTGGAVEEDAAVPDDTMVMERADAESVAPAGEVPGSTEETASIDEADTAPAVDGANGETEGRATSFAARIEEEAAASGTQEAVEATDPDAPAPDDARDDAEIGEPREDGAGENDLPRIATMPAPPETVLPDDAQAPAALETQETLPAMRIEETDGNGDASTAALDVVNGGMDYAEARETMIGAGWSPRLPANRTGGPNAAENAMIEAGYGELEGCNDAERPICRFEFVDDEKRIAAVLTAGTGTDPSVIDAFLMTIRAK